MLKWFRVWIVVLLAPTVACAESDIKIGVVLPYSGVYALLGCLLYTSDAADE